MSIGIGDNFNYQGSKFNMDRDSFQTKEAMKSYPETSLPPKGFRAYCAEDDEYYEFNAENSVDPETGKWRMVDNPTAKKTVEDAKTNGDYAKEQGDAAKEAARKVTNDVLFKVFQSLTEEEQTQVKQNIGIGVEQKFQGQFESYSELEGVSSPAVGDYAYVGNPRNLYAYKSSGWVNLGAFNYDIDQELNADSERGIANSVVVKEINRIKNEKLNKNSFFLKETDEDGVFFSNEKGEVFFEYTDDGFNSSKVSTLLAKKIYRKLPYLNNFTLRVSTEDLTEQISIDNIPDIKWGYSISFSCIIDDTIDSIIIKRSDLVITIDADNINVSYLSKQYLHSLEISKFLIITIVFLDSDNYGPKGELILTTVKGSYKTDFRPGSNSSTKDLLVYASNDGLKYTKCNLTYTAYSANRDVWVFGDSYLDYWARYVNNYGFYNVMFDGYGGRRSAAALESLKKCITYTFPRIIFWALGMNDGENNSMNTDWLNTIQEVIRLCDEHKVQLVLCVIPNAGNNSNDIKNKWVIQSGYRYVDFNHIVGGNIVSEDGDVKYKWYDGLKNDGADVHPSTLGSQVLASYFIAQVSECIER